MYCIYLRTVHAFGLVLLTHTLLVQTHTHDVSAPWFRINSKKKHIIIGVISMTPRFSLETTRFSSETPSLFYLRLLDFHLRPPDFSFEIPNFHRRPTYFYWDPQTFHWRPKKFFYENMVSTLRRHWRSQMKGV